MLIASEIKYLNKYTLLDLYVLIFIFASCEVCPEPRRGDKKYKQYIRSFSAAISLLRNFAFLYSIRPWHILRVLMTLFGKMT